MKSVLALAALFACRGQPPASTASVTLVDPGHEPRRAIAYAPRDGTRLVNLKLQDMTFVVQWRLDHADPTRYHYQGKDLIMTPPPKGDEASAIKTIATASSGEMGADSHGRATAASALDTDSTRDLLAFAIVPFPSEPVGVGARWHVGGRAAPGVQAIDAALDYELVAFDGDAIQVRWTGTMTDGQQLAASFAGTATVRPSDLLPVMADFTQKIDLAAAFGSALGSNVGSNVDKLVPISIR
jgi:hypothetical protein